MLPKLVPKEPRHTQICAIRPRSCALFAGVAVFAAIYLGFVHAGMWLAAWPPAMAAVICASGLAFAELTSVSTLDNNIAGDVEVVPVDDDGSCVDSEATASTVFLQTVSVCPLPDDARFDLVFTMTGKVIHSYERESAALGFIRDIVLFGNRQAATQFRLYIVRAEFESVALVEGETLVERALEDLAP